MNEKLGRNFERISALQKCIRRSMTDQAGYWFFAMAGDGFAIMALNRLRVISHEDIGPGDMQSCHFALRCIDDAENWYRGKNDAWRLAAANAILALCSANKCRAADHFQAVCLGKLTDTPNEQVPDFALDKHTRRGRQMGRGYEHFFAEGAKLINPDGSEVSPDRWHDEAVKYFSEGYFDKKPQQTIDSEPGLF